MATLVTTYNNQDKILATFEFRYWSDAIDFTYSSDMKAQSFDQWCRFCGYVGQEQALHEGDIVKFTVEKIKTDSQHFILRKGIDYSSY